MLNTGLKKEENYDEQRPIIRNDIEVEKGGFIILLS